MTGVSFEEQARPQELHDLALHQSNGTSKAMADSSRGGSRGGPL